MPFKQQPFWNLTTPGRLALAGTPNALDTNAGLYWDSVGARLVVSRLGAVAAAGSALDIAADGTGLSGDATAIFRTVSSGAAVMRLRTVNNLASELLFETNASTRWRFSSRPAVEGYRLQFSSVYGGYSNGSWTEITGGAFHLGGRLSLGDYSDAGNGRFQVASSTLASGGIGFGDFALYRTGTTAARLTASLTVDGVLSGNGSGLTSLPWSSLTGVPALAASSQWADILSKPAFAAIATSGAWSDLSGKPAAQTAISDIGANCGATISGTGDDIGLNVNFANIENRINAILNRLRTFGLPIINT